MEVRQWRAKVATFNFDVEVVGGAVTALLRRAVELEQERLALISTTWRWSRRRVRRNLSRGQPRCGRWHDCAELDRLEHRLSVGQAHRSPALPIIRIKAGDAPHVGPGATQCGRFKAQPGSKR